MFSPLLFYFWAGLHKNYWMDLTENLEGGRMGNGQKKNYIGRSGFFFSSVRYRRAEYCICALAVISKLLQETFGQLTSEIMMLMSQSLDTYIQEILLHHCVEDDGDEEIEDDGGTVLPSVMVKCHLSL